MQLPTPRGPASALLDRLLRRPAAPAPALADRLGPLVAVPDPLGDDDVQLALAVCYELHYRGFDGVDERWEWEPTLLAGRAVLERAVETALRATLAPPGPGEAEPVDLALRRLVDSDTGPSLSSYLMRRADVAQWREFLEQRSVYHLREADPHTWAVPRLAGRAKAALVEIQADEYGGGRPERMHATLFARTLRTLGLSDEYGAHWDRAHAATLATVNVMSLFGLHRRWVGALAGHLAALEMTSTTPNRRYGNGLRRLGFGADATAYFDEHVEADAVHEQIAAVDLCGSLVAAEPHLAGDVLFGAACCLAVEARFAADLLRRWGEPVDAAADCA